MYELFSGKDSYEDLSEADFNSLVTRKVKEGLYVEFKSSSPTNIKIASNIAAFANSEGGWLVLGIKEAADGLADECIGAKIENSDPALFFKNICRDLIAPFPVHIVRYVTKDDGGMLIAVEVPRSSNTPHICSDGTIPIRVGPSTEKIGISTQGELSRLVKRSEKLADDYIKFSKDNRRESEFKYGPSLAICIWPLTRRSPKIADAESMMSVDGLKKVKEMVNKPLPIALWEGMRSMMIEAGELENIPSHGTSQIPFDAVYSHGGSIFLEQGSRGGAFVELDMSARFKAHLPLHRMTLESKEIKALRKLSKKALGIAFEEGYEFAFDAVRAWQAAAHLISLYLAMVDEVDPVGGYRISLALNDVQGSVAYVDTDDWAQLTKECGYTRFHTRDRCIPVGGRNPYIICDDTRSLRSASVWMTSMLIGVPTSLLIDGWYAMVNSQREQTP